MVGVAAPQLSALIGGMSGDILDLPARSSARDLGDISATVTPNVPGPPPGPDDFIATIIGTGGFHGIPGYLWPVTAGTGDVGARIQTGGEADLSALIQFFGAGNIPGTIGTIPIGERDRFLSVYAQPVTPANLGAAMTINENVSFLGASILSLRDKADLGAFIRVAETFITAILTVTTLASSSLRATIGRPDCEGGSANAVLGALATAQYAGDMGALIESFVEHNLGASINTGNIFFAFDTINFIFSPYRVRSLDFNATDTISIIFSPFRGKDLAATITATLAHTSLGATVTATFPLLSVVPAVNRLTAVDLRLDREQDIQEVRLQMEGSLLEYFYLHGTDQALIRDPNEDWKINIRSFRPLAEGLFGDHAANRICRLGSLTSYATLDEAVRACIQAVLGFEDEGDLGGTITANEVINQRGGLGLDMSAYLNPMVPGRDFWGLDAAVYTVTHQPTLTGTISGVWAPPVRAADSGSAVLQAYTMGVLLSGNLGGTISGSGSAMVLGAFANPVLYRGLGGVIESGLNHQSLLFGGTNEYLTTAASLEDLGLGDVPPRFSVAFWVRWDLDAASTPDTFDTILGAATDDNWADGLGFFWEAGTAPEISFFVNSAATNKVTGDIVGEAQWTQVVGTFDAGAASDNLKLYLNGELHDSKTHTASIAGLTNILEIGRISSADPTASFPTQHFDEFGFWSGVALSGSEVSDLFDYGRIPDHDLTLNRGTYEHADNLVLYYKFEDTGSTFPTVTNTVSTSGTFDGTLVNMESTDVVEFTPSHNSASMEFTDTPYFTATGTNLPLVEDSDGSFSVAAWANASNSAKWNRAVCGMYHVADAVGAIPKMRLWHEYIGGPQYWTFEMNNTVNSPTKLQDSTAIDMSGAAWYFLVGTYDSVTGEMKLYVNGVLKDTDTLAGSTWRIDEFTIANARQSGGLTLQEFEGFLDTVAVWDTVLAQNDVDEIYNGGTAETDLLAVSSSSNLQAWYRLGEAGDTLITLRDRSPNHTTMTRVNTGNLISDEVPTT
jgi:hypothetical protein